VGIGLPPWRADGSASGRRERFTGGGRGAAREGSIELHASDVISTGRGGRCDSRRPLRGYQSETCDSTRRAGVCACDVCSGLPVSWEACAPSPRAPHVSVPRCLRGGVVCDVRSGDASRGVGGEYPPVNPCSAQCARIDPVGREGLRSKSASGASHEIELDPRPALSRQDLLGDDHERSTLDHSYSPALRELVWKMSGGSKCRD
jgi:hypothetical protein